MESATAGKVQLGGHVQSSVRPQYSCAVLHGLALVVLCAVLTRPSPAATTAENTRLCCQEAGRPSEEHGEDGGGRRLEHSQQRRLDVPRQSANSDRIPAVRPATTLHYALNQHSLRWELHSNL